MADLTAAVMAAAPLSVTSGGFGITLVIPQGCVSVALHAIDGDVYMSTEATPDSGGADSWILKQGIPETIEHRLLAGQTLRFKGVSGAVSLRYRTLTAPRS